MESPMAIDKKLIDQLLTDYKKPEDIIGENGLLSGSDRSGVRNVMGWRDEPLPVSVPTGSRDWARHTPSEPGRLFRAFSSYWSGGSIPGVHVHEPSGDRPDSLAGSSGAIARGPALGAVRDSCRKTDGREPA